ncbi:PIN/TRAM domain-containing protein [Desulforamulus ruminis]|uniref:PilT protein domain protein n=1 Tax=Desulforamulus ruminis (strain ATCC 23193 / DSM 2154 / NCIMB 8452 / DL) TaxID=696281 RepID=F6DNM5_DESRL|nr:PIN/TRAM domain-containing protein [Desulforamulus ruminis]AEG58565.1 PilT protein domain protein [Desulforamulus ruminis DSM 2154]
MIRKTLYGLIVLLFGSTGFWVGLYIVTNRLITVPAALPQLELGMIALGVLVGVLVGVLAAPWLIKGGLALTTVVDQYLAKTPTQDLIMGSLGLIFGLIIANLLGSILSTMGLVGKIIWLAGTFLLGYLGLSVAVKKREDIVALFSSLPRFGKEKLAKTETKKEILKVLDTSVIIDGRIAELCQSGFIEGTLLVPVFVVDELRHIADSADLLKRNRGRRGLDILNAMKKSAEIKVQIYENVKGLDDIQEVDAKLVKLGQKLGAKIVTNDYNLNKVAELQGVKVLNINELANAIKPVVLPGEEMTVTVVKDGKEMGQGVAYLDDGTMIVVDGGRRFIGQTVSVLVTSVLQTAAGRMIFAKPKNSDKRAEAGHMISGVNMIG